ncbi:hypothetical protein CCAND93_50012 [Capnocytophaga canis]|uniref:Uncharacterized protein n=1 Tax=Capnocytophaga canis TaxID=1848903 RepID=A0A0B7ISP8_9FLAO|nr:hypothetical protein CCAND93_50012 [Capnocytophaga canis]
MCNTFDFAVWTGLEPATPCVTGRYSNQLNYQTSFCECKDTIFFIFSKEKIFFLALFLNFIYKLLKIKFKY